MRVLTTAAELSLLPREPRRGAVFTMGALHAGHTALMHRCRDLIGVDGLLIVTIFVNPTQFNDPQDLERYPRTLDADLQICEQAGVDVVFAPAVTEMYPPGVQLPAFSAGDLGTVLEGASRPGHFDAVATVVHRLISLTQPDVTCFGEKDFQQLAVVRRMAGAAGLDCEIVGVPTSREPDGLALSSRNRLLTPAGRAAAPVLQRALLAVADRLRRGSDVAAAVSDARSIIASEPGVTLDYLVVTDESLNTSVMPTAGTPWTGRTLLAAYIDGVRLIDNVPLEVLAQ